MSEQNALRLVDRTCKTCKHFDGPHSWADGFGYCQIILPVWLKIETTDNTVYENASCDLHTATEAKGERE